MTIRKTLLLAAALGAMSMTGTAHAAAILKASYGFDGTLASSIAGAPALTPIDPAGGNGFATIGGSTPRTVYQARGSNTPGQQGGLQFDTTGLYSGSGYSASMTFRSLPTNSNWVRLFDTSDGRMDDGLYLSPSRLVTPFGGTNVTSDPNAAVNSSEFYNLTFTVDPAANSLVKAYLNGVEVVSATGPLLNLGPSGIMTLFRDNNAGGVQNEWAPADIDSFSFFDGVLTAGEVRARDGVALPPVSAVPEPASWAMMISGFGLIGGLMRRSALSTRVNKI